MLIEKSCLSKDSLQNKIVLVTGGGGGIGYELVRALIWLGAVVIIAEIDENRGSQAEKAINKEFHTNRAHFYKIDIGDEKQIDELYVYIKNRFGTLHVIFNNATIAPLGPVDTVSIMEWDRSYHVNLRAPVLLIQSFLPDMKKNNEGIIIFVPSSGAAPYMGAYEVFKTSQVELCNTLVGELENTNIITYAIGPGLVNTQTARRGIETVAGLMKISIEEFYKINEKQIIDEETAGTGFAVSVALASKYNGQEISSMQALMDAGVFSETPKEVPELTLNNTEYDRLKSAISKVLNTFFEQYSGWLNRNLFERQWILRDFKKTVGISADEMNNEMQQIRKANEENNFSFIINQYPIFKNMQKYYERQLKLLQGYEKNPQKLKESSETVMLWIEEIEEVLKYASK